MRLPLACLLLLLSPSGAVLRGSLIERDIGEWQKRGLMHKDAKTKATKGSVDTAPPPTVPTNSSSVVTIPVIDQTSELDLGTIEGNSVYNDAINATPAVLIDPSQQQSSGEPLEPTDAGSGATVIVQQTFGPIVQPLVTGFGLDPSRARADAFP